MEEEMDLTYYLEMLQNNWIPAAITFAVVLGIIVIYTLMTPPVYSASALMLVPDQDQANFILGSSSGPRIDLETQSQIMMSDAVLSYVYETYPKGTFSASAEVLKNSNIIQITVQSTKKDETYVIANLIVDSYMKYMDDSRAKDLDEVKTYVTSQIDSYDKQIETLTRSMVDYKAKNTARDLSADSYYLNLVREKDALERVYDYLVQKNQEVQLVSATRAVNIKSIEYATPPMGAGSPNVQLNLAVGVVLAGLAAIGAAFLSSKMNEDEDVHKHKKSKMF